MSLFQSRRRFRALIVDDSVDFRILLVRALAKQNVDCMEANDGLEADEFLAKGRFDLMVCDLRMPRKHGHQLMVELLDTKSPPMIVAVTGIIEPRITADLMRRGVTDVVTKPVDYELLATKLRALLERRADQMMPAAGNQANTVAAQIADATKSLKQQLVEITESFEETIGALEKQREDLEVGFLGSIRLFTNLIGRLKQSSGSHATRVAEMAVWLARATNQTNVATRDIEFAALLHEIGQFGMPDAIRSKPPWALNEDELDIYHQYPVIGAALLSEVHGMAAIVDIVEHHTEHFDGSGFPAGAVGKAIAVGARIVRIADGYDTFLMHTEGDGAVDACREHLTSQKGKVYDPDLIPLALTYLQDQHMDRRQKDFVLVDMSHVEVGMVLADDVYDKNGHFLMRQGAVMSEPVIERLRRLLRNAKVAVVAANPASSPEPSGDAALR